VITHTHTYGLDAYIISAFFFVMVLLIASRFCKKPLFLRMWRSSVYLYSYQALDVSVSLWIQPFLFLFCWSHMMSAC